jgi:hypothetical protein
MHCEKNLCENMLKTILGAKDSYGSRKDMEDQGIRRELWLTPVHNERDLFHLPTAPYILTTSERTTVLDIIKNLNTPLIYVGAIVKCVDNGKLRYMKSYNFHVFMHQVRLSTCGENYSILIHGIHEYARMPTDGFTD